ncbi:Calretinin [Acropora cervicornis]|uniref:Calretinin n=1 Tax=Acropora cervicornis TaxID=6130 RepID=A0AAD9QEC8_ACRCE|nr:Calretinin [Acropora cervicornis]
MAADSAAKPFVTSFQGKTQISSSDFLKIFKSFDKDGNGFIEAGELDEFLMALGRESNKEKLDPQEIAKMKQEILSKYDTNYDGKLDLEELTRILPTEENFLVQFQHHVKLTSVEFFKVWNHYDQDRSGFIESDELRLDIFDKNKDGKLSLPEMSKILPLEENFLAQFKVSILKLTAYNIIFDSKYGLNLKKKEHMRLGLKIVVFPSLIPSQFSTNFQLVQESYFLEGVISLNAVSVTVNASFTRKDGNGFINDEEIDALMHDLLHAKMKKELNSEDVAAFRNKIMKKCDTDRDGKINKEELKRVLLGQD